MADDPNDAPDSTAVDIIGRAGKLTPAESGSAETQIIPDPDGETAVARQLPYSAPIRSLPFSPAVQQIIGESSPKLGRMMAAMLGTFEQQLYTANSALSGLRSELETARREASDAMTTQRELHAKTRIALTRCREKSRRLSDHARWSLAAHGIAGVLAGFSGDAFSDKDRLGTAWLLAVIAALLFALPMVFGRFQRSGKSHGV